MNDFDKPYIAIEFASRHFIMDTISNSLLSHLVLSLLHALNFFHLESFQKINNYSTLHKYYRRLSNHYRRGISGNYQRIKMSSISKIWVAVSHCVATNGNEVAYGVLSTIRSFMHARYVAIF